MRRDGIALTAVEVQNFHGESGPFNDSINQGLKPDLVNLGFDGFDSGCAILIQWHGNKRLIPLGIQFHPRTREKLALSAAELIASSRILTLK